MRVLLLKKQKTWAESPTGKRHKKRDEQRAKLEEQRAKLEEQPQVPVFNDNIFGWRGPKRWRRSYRSTYRCYAQDIWGSLSIRHGFGRVALDLYAENSRIITREYNRYRQYSFFLRFLLQRWGSVFGIRPLLFRMRSLWFTRTPSLAFSLLGELDRVNWFLLPRVVDDKNTENINVVEEELAGLLRELRIVRIAPRPLFIAFFHRILRRRVLRKWINATFFESLAVRFQRADQLAFYAGRRLGHRFFKGAEYFTLAYKPTPHLVPLIHHPVHWTHQLNSTLIDHIAERKGGGVQYYWENLFSVRNEIFSRLDFGLSYVPPRHPFRVKPTGFWRYMELNSDLNFLDSDTRPRRPKSRRARFVPFTLMSTRALVVREPRSRRSALLRFLRKARLFYGNTKPRSFARRHIRITRGSSAVANLLERRLDILLVRALFCRHIFEAQTIIRLGHITVGGVIVRIPSFIVDAWEIVSVVPLYRRTTQERIITYLLNDQVLGIPPAYLLLDYRSLCFTFDPVEWELHDAAHPIELRHQFTDHQHERR